MKRKTNILDETNQHIENLKTSIAASTSSSELETVGKILTEITSAMQQVRNIVHTIDFNSREEEIKFFKELKPVLISQYVYHQTIFRILLRQPAGHVKQVPMYEAELEKLQRYINRHASFYQYVISGGTQQDHQYFIRNNYATNKADFDYKFSTGYDNILGRFLATEMIRTWLLTKMQPTPVTSTLTWTAPKSALIELIYALQASDAINDGQADLKAIASTVETCFNVSLGNYYRVFQDIRLRKINPTVFLDDLKVRLQKRISENL